MAYKRIRFIDLAKGFAMLCVLIGHIDTYGWIKSSIYSFHMPIFFILSGYFLHEKYEVYRLKKMVRSILIPYFIVGIGLWLTKSLIDGNFKELLRVPLVVYKWNSDVISVGAIWFLPVIFLGKLWLLLVLRYKYRYTLLLGCACISLLFTKQTNIVIPFGIQQAIICAPFLMIGHEMKSLRIFDRSYSKDFIISIGIVCLFFANTVSVAMRVNSMSVFNYLTASIISFLIIYSLSRIEKSNNYIIHIICIFFTWCGRYSLIILCVHSIESRFEWFSLPHNLFVVEIIIRWAYIVLITWGCTKLWVTKRIFNLN
jgi:fucose 4-O-acetylase-like acetyltransferase